MGSVEQQIYASLADETLKAGHHTHAATPGLDATAIERHEEICNHWGQYEAGSPFKRSLVHLPLYEAEGSDPSHHLVILVTDQGRDARGRPGAMLRHVVRMDAATFASFDHNPFHLWRKGLLLGQWTPQTPFPVIEGAADPTSRSDLQSIFPERYALLRGLLGHLLATGKLHLQASEDSPAAEETLAQLLELLPPARRASLALTTFAYANAGDYQLAVVRRAETTLRASLERFLDEPVEGLHDDDRAYLDRLFGALAAKDWAAAAACVHGEPVRRETMSPPPSHQQVPFTHRKAAASPSGASASEDLGEWAPSFRRAGAQKKSGKGRRVLWFGALAVVVLGIGAFALLQRGAGNGGPAAGRVNTRVEASADLGALVDEHARRLRTLLDQGSRDFDVAEAMRGMHARLAETVEGTMQRERQMLTDGAAATQGDPTAMALHLRTAADRLTRASRRLAALETALVGPDVDAVRAAAAANAGSGLDLGETEATGPVASAPALWAAELGEAAASVRATAELTWPPTEADWNAKAAALSATASAHRVVDALAEALRAQTDLVASFGRDAGRLGDPIVPFERTAADAARNAAVQAHRSWGGLPAPMAAMDVLLALGMRAGERPRGAAARDWMAELGIATRADAPLGDVVEQGPVRAWLARWRVEVLRGVDGDRSADGWNGFAAANAQENAQVATRLDALDAAPNPAGAELIESVRQQQGRLQDPLHRALLADWLRRQEQGRARTGSAFGEVYTALGRAHAAFVANPSSATWTQLRAALAATEASGLDAVARDPARKAEVDAVRAYGRAIGTPVSAQINGVRVELLRRADYSGSERSLAQLRALLVRRADERVLWQAGAPPVLAPPGAAFQQIAIPGGTPLQVGATEGLVLVVRDEKTSMLWGHVWIDAAQRGHVLDTLARTHEVRVSEQQQRALQEATLPAAPDGTGELLARITVDVDPSFWAALASALPALP